MCLRSKILISVIFLFILLHSPDNVGAGKQKNITAYFITEQTSTALDPYRWVSVPFSIPVAGKYTFNVQNSRQNTFHILIDGETYENLKDITLEEFAKKAIFLDEGQHSLIFYSQDSNIRLKDWTFQDISISDNLNSYIDTRKNWKPLNRNSRTLEIGRMFTGSYINVNIARETVLFTRNHYQYISYYNPDGFIVVGRRHKDSTYFEKYFIPINGLSIPRLPARKNDISLSNPHDYISMQMDAEGYLHLAYGQHNSKLRYVRSTLPYEISNWTKPTHTLHPSVNTSVITYVSFINSGNALLSMFRVGTHGFGEQVLLSYNTALKKWSPVHIPFITAEQKASPYFWNPAVSNDGTIHLFWTWRLSSYDETENNPLLRNDFSGFTNTDIYYAKSNDKGSTWTSARGTTYKLPIKMNSEDSIHAEVVADIPIGDDFFNHFGSALDNQEKPYIVYTRRGAENQAAQQWITYWDDISWKTYQVTNYFSQIDWTRNQQEGHASPDLMRPNILIDKNNRVIVFSRSKETKNVPELYISEGTNYDKWKKINIYDGPVGGWEPQYDADVWNKENKMQLLLLGITDKAVYDAYHLQDTRSLSTKIADGFKLTLERFTTIMRSLLINGSIYNIDYYSKNQEVEILKVDKSLQTDTGYLLEINPFE